VSESTYFGIDHEPLVRLMDGLVSELDSLHRRLIQIDRLTGTLLTDYDSTHLEEQDRGALQALQLVATEYMRAYEVVRDDMHAARVPLARTGPSA
jgi:hypothetical protein